MFGTAPKSTASAHGLFPTTLWITTRVLNEIANDNRPFLQSTETKTATGIVSLGKCPSNDLKRHNYHKVIFFCKYHLHTCISYVIKNTQTPSKLALEHSEFSHQLYWLECRNLSAGNSFFGSVLLNILACTKIYSDEFSKQLTSVVNQNPYLSTKGINLLWSNCFMLILLWAINPSLIMFFTKIPIYLVWSCRH